MKKITFCDYIAEQVPNKAYEILNDSGLNFPRPRSNRELASMLKKFVKIDREIALKSLARIHPDRQLIESIDREVKDADFEIKKVADSLSSSKEKNFNACGACAAHMNCSGPCSCGRTKPTVSFDGENKSDNTALIVTLGFFTLLYVLINRDK